MSRLVVPKIEPIEIVANYGKFKAEPVEKGFGVTLGNSLRRVLLSYLPGAAVTRVRIDGVQHEFTVIPHSKEDVIEFILNVKALRLKALANRPGKLVLEVQKEGRVAASDIKPSTDFEIVNPQLPLLTLDSPEAKLFIEFDIDLGQGFRPAEAGEKMPIGTIPVDAIFSPIRKVNFTIEPIHIGQETSNERLVLEIWTDGTVTPSDALSLSAGILVEQLAPFTEYTKISQLKADEQAIRLAIPDEKFNMPIEQMDLSVRTMNCLRRSGITSVGELVSKRPKDLLKLRNFGQKSFREIEERLKGLGLSLAGDKEEEAPKRKKTSEAEEEPVEAGASEAEAE